MTTSHALMTGLLLSCVVVAGSLSADDSSGPAPDREELKLLDRLRGEWTGTLDGDSTGMRLTLSSKWILGRNVLQTTLKTGETESLLLRTWDENDEHYVATYMDNSGTVLLMTGAWDENQQELSTSTTSGGDHVKLTTRFIDETTVRWSVTHGDATISGINRRKSR